MVLNVTLSDDASTITKNHHSSSRKNHRLLSLPPLPCAILGPYTSAQAATMIATPTVVRSVRELDLHLGEDLPLVDVASNCWERESGKAAGAEAARNLRNLFAGTPGGDVPNRMTAAVRDDQMNR